VAFKEQVERGVELLVLAQQLQSKVDGVERPLPGEFDGTKTLDQFAMDVDQAVMNMLSLHKLMPMMVSLAAVGRKLQAEGKIDVKGGDSLSDATLRYLKAEYGVAE